MEELTTVEKKLYPDLIDWTITDFPKFAFCYRPKGYRNTIQMMAISLSVFREGQKEERKVCDRHQLWSEI
jgi:hypothetical protein